MISTESVDEYMLTILERKSELFAEYVRERDLRDAAPRATDTEYQEPKPPPVSQAEAERLILEAERERLGLPP